MCKETVKRARGTLSSCSGLWVGVARSVDLQEEESGQNHRGAMVALGQRRICEAAQVETRAFSPV